MPAWKIVTSATASRYDASGTLPAGSASGLVFEHYARLRELTTDTIGSGEVARQARRMTRPNQRLDLCLIQFRCSRARDALGPERPLRRQPEPMLRRQPQQTEQTRKTAQLRGQRHDLGYRAGGARRIELARDALQHRQRVGRIEIIVQCRLEARTVCAEPGSIGRGRRLRLDAAQRRV